MTTTHDSLSPVERGHPPDEALNEALESLRATNERLSCLLGCGPTILYSRVIAGERPRIDWVSDNIERITGHSIAAALLPGWWVTHLHPDDRAAAIAASARLQEHGGAHEYRFLGGDGRYRWIRDEQRPTTWDDGRTRIVLGAWSDVTERREAETAMRESEALLRGAFDAAPIGMALTTPDGRWLRVNRSLCEIVGYTESELLATDVQSITHPDDLTISVELKQRLLGGELPSYLVQKRYVHRDGHSIWASVSVAIVRDSAGGTRFLLAQVQDITEQRLAAEALRESEMLLRETEALASVGSWGWNVRTGAVTWSDEIYRIFGLMPRSESPSYGGYRSRVHPDDRERGEAALADALARGIVFSLDQRIVRSDGVVRQLHIRGRAAVDADGALVRLIGSAQDTTERTAAERALRENEERFRALMERASDLVAVVDAGGRVRYASPSYERGLGYPIAALLGMLSFDLVHPEDVARVREVVARLLASPDHPQAVEARLRHAGGAWREFELLGSNLLANPAVGGIVVSGRDVTERRSLEAQLRQAQKMEAVGQLAGGVAHDFNNLLTVIRVHTELALEEVEADHPLRQDLMEIRNASSRAASLTRQLLAFSRKQLLQPRRIDLNVVIIDLQKMLARLIGEDIQIVLSLAPGLGAVLADPGQLEQVLVNLAVNARDAMPDGGRLTVATSERRVSAREPALHADVQSGPMPPGDYVVLTVSDTGCGMPPEVRERVFEPFFTTKPIDRGTGLGLSTVYGIVKQSGGHIALESAPGRGTTFAIYLPRHMEPRTPTGGEDPSTRPRGAETILLVEDEVEVRTLARRILERQGYQVVEASSEHDALRLAAVAGQRIDLVLTDLVMPTMNGRAMAERLVAMRPGLNVLYMSGYTDDEIVRRGLLDSGMRLLHKPFAVDELAGAVRDALDEKKRAA